MAASKYFLAGLLVFLAALSVLAPAGPCRAAVASSQHYGLALDVIGNAGGFNDSAAYRSVGTACQASPIGVSSSSQYNLQAGFWGAAEAMNAGLQSLAFLAILLGGDDSDNDGMPDDWEIAYGLNPNVNDANLDPDGDGLTNLQEYKLGTNPKKADTDGDGMPDGWEVQNGLNPKVNDCNVDTDGDGWTNCQEYLFRTNPMDKNSHPNKGLPWLSIILFE